jgi:hypothetical protein
MDDTEPFELPMTTGATAAITTPSSTSVARMPRRNRARKRTKPTALEAATPSAIAVIPHQGNPISSAIAIGTDMTLLPSFDELRVRRPANAMLTRG